MSAGTLDAITVVASLVFSVLALFVKDLEFGNFPAMRLFRIFRVIKIISAYNRIMKSRERYRDERQLALSNSPRPPVCNWRTAPRGKGSHAKTCACFAMSTFHERFP